MNNNNNNNNVVNNVNGRPPTFCVGHRGGGNVVWQQKDYCARVNSQLGPAVKAVKIYRRKKKEDRWR